MNGAAERRQGAASSPGEEEERRIEDEKKERKRRPRTLDSSPLRDAAAVAAAMQGRCHDSDDEEEEAEADPRIKRGSSSRRSISMGDFQRATGQGRSEPPSAAATAPSSRLVTPSSSMEFAAARRRLLEVEERQRVIREMESHLEELRQVFVKSEREAAEHGELVARISNASQQGELFVAENSQRLKKTLRFKKHRPSIVFSSMLGLRTCLPWPVKLK